MGTQRDSSLPSPARRKGDGLRQSAHTIMLILLRAGARFAHVPGVNCSTIRPSAKAGTNASAPTSTLSIMMPMRIVTDTGAWVANVPGSGIKLVSSTHDGLWFGSIDAGEYCMDEHGDTRTRPHSGGYCRRKSGWKWQTLRDFCWSGIVVVCRCGRLWRSGLTRRRGRLCPA
jgi:hypothetical protein